MEQCTYGHIPEEEAEANIQFIVKACNSYDPTHDQQVRKDFAEERLDVMTVKANDAWDRRTVYLESMEAVIAHLRAMAETL